MEPYGVVMTAARTRTLSPYEQQILNFEKIRPGTAAYNVPVAMRFRRPIERRRIEEAVGKLVRRHEPLRTRFYEETDHDVAHVAERDDVCVECSNVGGGGAALQAEIARASARPFELSAEIPFRAHYFEAGPDERVLLLVVHHIVCDMVSLNLLLDDLGAELHGRRSTARAGSVASNGALTSTDEDHPSFWVDEFRQMPPSLSFRDAPELPAGADVRVNDSEFSIEPEVARGLRHVAERSGATLFNVLLSVYGVVVARLSGQAEFVVGVPASVRTAQTARQIGCFVTTLPVRFAYDEDERVGSLVSRVKARTDQALRHRGVRLDSLTAHGARKDAGAAAKPLVQCCLNYRSFDTAVVDWLEDVWRPATGYSPFDVTLTMEKVGRGLRGRFELARSTFAPERCETFVEAMRCALASVADDPHGLVRYIALIGDATRSDLIREACGPPLGAAQATHVADEIVNRMRERRTAAAVVDPRGRHSYEAVVLRAAALAQRLNAAGALPGDVVGLCVSDGADVVAGILGAWFARTAYVALDPELPSERLRRIVAKSGVRITIVPDDFAKDDCHGSRVVHVVRETVNHRVPKPLGPPGDAPAYVLYTSGSTGSPKGVAISHKALALSMLARRRHYAASRPERAVLLYSYAVDASIAVIVGTLLAGGTVYAPCTEVRRDAPVLADFIEMHKVTHWDSVPSHWSVMMDVGGAKLKSLRTVVLGGERLPPALAERHLASQSSTLTNEYGPTEATIWATVADVPSNVGIGRPIPGMRAYVLDRHGELVAPGVVGELCLGGEMLALGYWRRPDLTAERFVDRWGPLDERLYCTGDLVRRSRSGDLLFDGRADRQVQLRGHRIELAEIEAALEREPSVREASVLMRGDGGDAALVAFIALVANASSENVVRDALAPLPGYMHPSRVAVLPALPRTATGKVDTAALQRSAAREESHAADGEAPRTLDGGAHPRPAYEPPRGSAEETVSQIWSELLKVGRVGRQDNFFALGGHSLLAARAVTRIGDELGVPLRVRDLFRCQTLDAFAQTIGRGPESLDLPFDRPRSANAEHRCRQIDLSLDCDLSERLIVLAKRLGATPATIVLAVWATLLSRVSGQASVMVGTPVSESIGPKLEDVIGAFSAIVPLQIECSRHDDVNEVIRCVTRRMSREQQDGRRVPDGKLPKASRFAKGGRVQVVFARQHRDCERGALPAAHFQPIDIAYGITKFELMLLFVEDGETIVLSLGYDAALFDHATAEKFVQNLRGILSAIAADDTPVTSP